MATTQNSSTVPNMSTAPTMQPVNPAPASSGITAPAPLSTQSKTSTVPFAGVGSTISAVADRSTGQAQVNANRSEAMSSTVPMSTVPKTVTGQNVGGTPLKPGLSSSQIASVQSLATKPTSTWSATDKQNWAYATNNAPLPSAGVTTPGVPATPAIGSGQQAPASTGKFTSTQVQELNTAYQRIQNGTGTAADKENVAYAQKNGWTPTTAKTTPAASTATAGATTPSSATATTATGTPTATQQTQPKEMLDTTNLPKSGGFDMTAINAADAAAKASADELKKIKDEYIAAGAKIGEITPEEQKRIDDAGAAAAAQYDAAIAAQKEEKRQQEAKDYIGAGQRGGFLSTQFAGVGALSQTEGGTFVGAGGVLARNQDLYSQAVADLEAKKISAVQAAKEAQVQAIKSGKKEDLERMKEAFNMVGAIQQQQQDEADRMFTRQTQLQEIAQYEKQNAADTMASLAEAGYTADQIPPEYMKELETAMQMPSGYGKKVFQAAEDVRIAAQIKDQQEREKAELDNASKIVDILDKVPYGQMITIGGNTYTGQRQGDFAYGTESDANGNTVYWQVDKNTGETITTSLGAIGKPQDGFKIEKDDNGQLWSVNPNTGQMMPMYPGSATTDWSQTFPDGSQLTQYRSSTDPYIGQCGAFLNDLYAGGKVWGNKIEEKLAAAKQYEVPNKNDIRVGDSIVMDAGNTGHVAIVNQVAIKDGKITIRLTESNYIPPNGGVISNSRPMSIDDPKLLAVARIPLNPQRVPLAGPDAPKGPVPTFGAKTGANADVSLFAQGLASGDFKISDIPQDIRGQVLMTAKSQYNYSGAGSTDVPKLPDLTTFAKNLESELIKSGSTGYLNQGAIQAAYQEFSDKAPVAFDAASYVSSNMPEKQAAAFNTSVKTALQKGDIDGALEQIKNGALSAGNVSADERTKIRGRDAGISALENIKGLLDEYKAKGGNTNIFKGKEAQIAEKAGTLTDPALKKIATNIATTLIDYRKSVSGAAFTESEGKEYSQLFPSTSGTYDLNLAKIDGLLSAWKQSNDSFYTSVLTPTFYNSLFN